MERICSKDHGGPKCPLVVPFEILHSEGPFEVDSFEHFGLATMIVFTPKLIALIQPSGPVVFKPVLHAPLPCTVCMYPLSDTPDSTHQLVSRDCKT